MTRQRDSPQMKGQEVIIARDLLKTDKSKISEKEFRSTVIRLLAGSGRKKYKKNIKDTREILAAEIKGLKTSPTEKKCYNLCVKPPEYNHIEY